LAQTVGITVAAIGIGLAQAGSRPRVPRELRTVALTSAAGLAFVDLYFVARARISKIYLADAAAEVALVLAWLLAPE
jgi:ribonuclease P protein component